MDIKKQYFIAVVLVTLSFLGGRFSSPAKIITKEIEKVVYKENTEKERNRDVTETTKQTKLPDGTIITETTKNSKTDIKSSTQKETESDKESEKIVENRPDYRVTLVYEPSITSFQDVHYQGIIEKRLFSEIYVGVSARSDKQFGVSVSLGF